MAVVRGRGLNLLYYFQPKLTHYENLLILPSLCPSHDGQVILLYGLTPPKFRSQ
jgi:hypothetical protein